MRLSRDRAVVALAVIGLLLLLALGLLSDPKMPLRAVPLIDEQANGVIR